MKALDEADVERARRHPIYKFLLDRLQKAAEGNGDAESVMEEVASSKESAPTSVNQENVVAATEQFEADLNGPLAELWQQALKQDMQGEARAAAKVEAQINPAAERSVARNGKERTVKRGAFSMVYGVISTRNGSTVNCWRSTRRYPRAAPDPETVRYQKNYGKDRHARSRGAKRPGDIRNDLGRGVVQNIVDTFESRTRWWKSRCG